MAKQAKPSSAEKIRQYLRKKYMKSESEHDRIAEHEDWRDGMNAFRLRTHQALEEIYKQLQQIQERLNEQNSN